MPKPGDDLDEGIHAEAEEREGLVLGAEVHGDEAFQQVVGDREDRQPEGVLPESILGWPGKCSHRQR